jgi:hypothetical protein
MTLLNEDNILLGGEGSTGVPFPPPQTNREPETRSLTGPFFFLFQKGLAIATALRRLSKCAKLVSERRLSLTNRPTAPEGRFQKVM